MRYALLEFIFVDNKPVFKWAATDLSLSSAHDARSAWNYQATQKGGYMEVIEDTQEAFDKRKARILEFHPRCNNVKG